MSAGCPTRQCGVAYCACLVTTALARRHTTISLQPLHDIDYVTDYVTGNPRQTVRSSAVI
jgi:hypothetical protein